ncbi:tripartite motif-containing protein 2-like [Saccoglossus kowalevskii]
MYCESCEVPVCSECSLILHQGDHHKHVTLKTAAKKKKSKIFETMAQVKEKIPEMKIARVNFNMTKDKLLYDRTVLYKQIKTIADNMKKDIERAECILLQDVQNHFVDKIDGLEKDIARMDTMMEYSKNIVSIGDNMKWSEIDTWVFFLEKQYGKQMQDIANTETRLPVPVFQSTEFHPNNDLASKMKEGVGKLTISDPQETIQLSSINRKQFKRIKTIESSGTLNRKRVKQPRGVTLLDDDSFYVADMGNDRVLKYTTHAKYQMEFQFVKPYDITAVDTDSSLGGNIFVTDGKELTRCSDTGVVYYKEDLVSEKLLQPLGITTDITKKYLYFVGISKEESESHFTATDLTWPDVKSNTKRNTNVLFSDFGSRKDRKQLIFEAESKFVAVNSKNQIITADTRRGTVLIFDAKDRRFVSSFGSQGKNNGQFINPMGVAVNSKDEIIVCSKGRIQMFSPDGSFLFRIDRDEDKLHQPVAVCVTKKLPQRIIATVEDEDGNGRIVIYKEN